MYLAARILILVVLAGTLWAMWAPGFGAIGRGQGGYRSDDFGFCGWYEVVHSSSGYEEGAKGFGVSFGIVASLVMTVWSSTALQDVRRRERLSRKTSSFEAIDESQSTSIR
jgi:hypothetical protein